jgi:hypothetical protein
MFHGGLRSAALADQLSARFNDRQHRVSYQLQIGTALVQIGSVHGTPVTVHTSFCSSDFSRFTPPRQIMSNK